MRNIFCVQQGRNMQGSRNCIHTSVSSSSIVFSPTIVKRSTQWFTFSCTPVACLTIFSFFKQAPSFTPVSPYTPHFLLFPTHFSCLIVPAAWLVQWSQSQRTSSSAYQSCAHFHREPLCALGSVAKKRTDGEQKTGETREGGREKGASTWAAARFSRWGYLICLVNLRHGVDVYCTQHAHVCNDECVSASLTILYLRNLHVKVSCWVYWKDWFISGSGWINLYCIRPYPYSAGNKLKQMNHWRQANCSY